jgi:hypothetical protein
VTAYFGNLNFVRYSGLYVIESVEVLNGDAVSVTLVFFFVTSFLRWLIIIYLLLAGC